ncbi:hypothetical protein [Dechloromonas sp.]|uniref:hypothetical protein n=1 Tax=Dechloromonas sp. TaxID=1917218 RepID=UPI00286E3594|nr:hypothetical protein [Dechloromonas sp.]
MNRFISELTRLYFLPGQEWQTWLPSESGEPAYVMEGLLTPEVLAERLATESNVGLTLVSPDGMVRAMVISLANGSYWEQLAALYQGVQEDFDVPAPAISVSVEDGYQIWFSLAEPVPLQQAQAFLNALRLKYLNDIPVARLKFRPGIEDGTNVHSLSVLPLMQALKEPERWSAFIDPSMGCMFIDESWLEMAPNLDQQAAMLAEVETIKAEDFQRVMSIMQAAPAFAGTPVENAARSGGDRLTSSLGVDSHFTDPKSFLMAVMNDPQTSAHDRIEAAKALLPYFENLKAQ